MKEYGNKSLDLLSDFNIDFGISIGDEVEEGACISEKLWDVLGPLAEIKIVGIKIFKFFLEHYEREEKLQVMNYSTNLESLSEESNDESDDNTYMDNEKEEGNIEIDWNGMFNSIKSRIAMLMQEGKHEEMEEEIKQIRAIPLSVRLKMVKNRVKTIGKIEGTADVEAVKKYVTGETDQKKCLQILEDIREGNMRIEDRDGYSSGKNRRIDKEKRKDALLRAAKQAIEANDLPSLKALSKGCFLPSNKSIQLDANSERCLLFEYSCRLYSYDCALYLLKAGGGIEQEFEEGDKPLFQALRGGNEEIGLFLIGKGANCKVRGQSGYTVLHAASIGNCAEAIKLLIERGADIELKDNDGKTPLHQAASRNSAEAAKMLIEKGANIEARDKDGKSPLHNAAEKNNIEAAKLLIANGANMESKSRDGKTTLQLAINKRSFKVAKLLIEKGANIESYSDRRSTPLHWAAEKNSVEIAQLFIERGANIIKLN